MEPQNPNKEQSPTSDLNQTIMSKPTAIIPDEDNQSIDPSLNIHTNGITPPLQTSPQQMEPQLAVISNINEPQSSTSNSQDAIPNQLENNIVQPQKKSNKFIKFFASIVFLILFALIIYSEVVFILAIKLMVVSTQSLSLVYSVMPMFTLIPIVDLLVSTWYLYLLFKTSTLSKKGWYLALTFPIAFAINVAWKSMAISRIANNLPKDFTPATNTKLNFITITLYLILISFVTFLIFTRKRFTETNSSINKIGKILVSLYLVVGLSIAVVVYYPAIKGSTEKPYIGYSRGSDYLGQKLANPEYMPSDLKQIISHTQENNGKKSFLAIFADENNLAQPSRIVVITQSQDMRFSSSYKKNIINNQEYYFDTGKTGNSVVIFIKNSNRVMVGVTGKEGKDNNLAEAMKITQQMRF